MNGMQKVPTSWKTGLQRMAPGVYAYIQAGGLNVSNAGLVVGDDEALVVDALYVRPMTQAFQESIRKATRKPVRKIVCTHHHADHTLGLTWFDKDIPIIAHRYMRERMVETGLDLAHYRGVNPEHAGELKNLKQRFPTIAYEGGMTLRLGKRVVELHHLGHAHSKGDTVVYLPKERVLFTGDICFHFVTPATFDGHISGWIRIAEKILKTFSIERVVPGHGPPGDKGALQETLGYLRLVRREAKKRFEKGMPPMRAAREIPLGRYADWMKPDRVEQAVMKLYNEFKGRGGQGISLHDARGG